MSISNLPPLPPDPPTLSEIQIQAKGYQYIFNNFPALRQLIFHVPNGGSRDAREGMQLKASGVTAGVPDLLFISQGKLHFIEVKRASERFKSSGGCSQTQIELHKIWHTAGIPGIIAYSSQEIVDYVVQVCNLTHLQG